VSSPIFISYSSKDQEIAETIYEALEARGYNCWIACRDVRAGENFQEAIVKALRSAQVMLLVFTSNANNSDEIKKELVLAGRHRVTVVPVRVEDVVPNDAFTYEFATRQWVDLFKDWEREIEQLATQLGHVLQAVKPPEGAATTATPVPPRRTVKRSSSHQLLIAGIALVAVVLFGGIVVYLKPWGATSPTTPPPTMTTQAPPTQSPPVQTPPPGSAAVSLPPASPQPPAAVSPSSQPAGTPSASPTSPPASEPAVPALTTHILKSEPPIGQLPTGAKALVDDGTCPTGKIKQVVGGKVTTGQPRLRSCVPRP
jgi:hypothetical protein